MMPSYLKDLYLPLVFNQYTSTVGAYIQESAADEHIVDSVNNKISGFVTSSFGQMEDSMGKYFEVKNPTATPFALLQIDNGIIQSPKTKKCDCAIANGKEICFIEFKANAYSSSLSAIKRNYRKAIAQIERTIDIFDSYYVTCGRTIRTLRAVEAYICFRKGYPRSTSSQMNYQVSFAKRNKGIPLSFSSKKIL